MKNLSKTVLTLNKVKHREAVQLLVLFPFNFEIKEILKEKLGYKWSQTLKGWYISYSLENIQLLKTTLNKKVQFKLDASLRENIELKSHKSKRNPTNERKEILRLYVQFLNGKKINKNTIKSYFTFLEELFNYYQDIPIHKINNNLVKKFNDDIFQKNDCANSQLEFGVALKLFKDFFPESALKTPHL